MSRILLVDDDPDYSFALVHLLRSTGHHVELATGGTNAVEQARAQCFDVALVDLSLPDIHGLQLLDQLAHVDPLLPVVFLTGSHDTTEVVTAMRKGAVDYLTKPATLERLTQAVTAATSWSTARRAEIDRVANNAVGSSAAWRNTMAHIQAAAAAPRTTVLVTGETGVGKEVTATLLHALSARRRGPLVQANAACFSPGLLESELFGHEAGAFTGAVKRRRGLFEQADGGVLFLDEIGELALDLQSKLLRLLEGHPFRRVGGEEPVRCDVRLVAATHRDLPAMVAEGKFRADLLARLRVFEIRVPPLRERVEDIRELAHAFAARLGAELQMPSTGFTPQAMALLERYHWPGNIRELKNTIERALVLANGSTIDVRHLSVPSLSMASANGPAFAAGLQLPPATPAPDGDASLERITRDHIVSVFQACAGNVTHTAERLGMSRLAVRKRLQGYGLRPARN